MLASKRAARHNHRTNTIYMQESAAVTEPRQYLDEHQDDFLRELAEIVAIEGVSTDGQHKKELAAAAAWTKAALARAGFERVEAFPTEGGADLIVGQQLVDPQLPTVLFYSH